MKTKTQEVIYDLYLYGFFTEVIDEIKHIQLQEDLLKFCYLDSLLELNKFDEFYEEIQKTPNNIERNLLTFWLKLFTFNMIPSYHYSKFSETKDYYKEFQKLSEDFYSHIGIDSDSPYFNLIKLIICDFVLDIIDAFFKVYKYSLSEYTRIREHILRFVEEIESKYSNFVNDEKYDENSIWKALIFDYIGAIYSYYDSKNKEKLCYERSMSYRFNIFALTDLIDCLEEDESEDEAFDYLKTAELSWKFDRPIKGSEYYPYFSIKAQLLEKENKKEAERNYYRAIEIIERNMKYKTIPESYPYYNLGLLKNDNEEYLVAENYFEKAIRILEEATDIRLSENISENITYFLNDFQDYLYEICRTQILQKEIKKEIDYNKTLDTLNYIAELTNKLGYDALKASLKYDIALLYSKIYDSQKKYKKMIEQLEGCLANEENYLSDEQEAHLRAILAYGYIRTSNFEKYEENISKSLDLNPKEKTALKLIAQTKVSGVEFISKNHFNLLWKTVAATSILMSILTLLYKLLFLELPSFLLFLITGSWILIVCTVLLYPLISHFKIGPLEAKMKELEIPGKEPKLDIF